MAYHWKRRLAVTVPAIIISSFLIYSPYKSFFLAPVIIACIVFYTWDYVDKKKRDSQ